MGFLSFSPMFSAVFTLYSLGGVTLSAKVIALTVPISVCLKHLFHLSPRCATHLVMAKLTLLARYKRKTCTQTAVLKGEI